MLQSAQDFVGCLKFFFLARCALNCLPLLCERVDDVDAVVKINELLSNRLFANLTECKLLVIMCIGHMLQAPILYKSIGIHG